MAAGDSKVYLVIVWHMHQPDYFDPEFNEIVLPWVRLHGCKGYTDMPFHLSRHPGVKATFNFSGTLLHELSALSADGGRARRPGGPQRADRYHRISLKPPGDLTYEDKIYILKHFFSLAPQTIKSSPRLFDLLGKRGRNISDAAISEIIKKFEDRDFMDLQVLFNLLWFGKVAFDRYGWLGELKKKGGGFTQEEKERLFGLQGEVASRVLGTYAEMASAGQIEISLTPYFHPILPIVLDSDCASEGLPGMALPEKFSFPDDAMWHVTEAVGEYRKIFGRDPEGVWPAEGSVSEQAVGLFAELGFKWAATDEGILWRSLRSSLPGPIRREDLLYRPYRLGAGGTAIFFRDHYLSDRLGFTYQTMDVKAAVEDFISYLRQISSSRPDGAAVVAVILDGENPWPYYPEDGAPFLDALYGRLKDEKWIETTTPSRLLSEGAPCGDLGCLFPGSWIDSNFHVWIGDHAKNRAWKMLVDTRRAVASSGAGEEKKKKAMEHIMAAEGSDWFWWYGEPNSSTEDPIFDQLFRSRLRTAMREVGGEIPVALLKPPGICVEPAPVVKSPLTFIHPGIDGTGETFFEWYNAGKYEIRRISGEMTTAPPLFSTVFYGFDYDFIYIRMDPLATPSKSVEKRLININIRFIFDEERERWVEIAMPSPLSVKVRGASGGREGLQVAFNRILEAAIPIRLFGLDRGSRIKMNFLIMQNDIFVERYPDKGYFEIQVPDENWDKRQWIV